MDDMRFVRSRLAMRQQTLLEIANGAGVGHRWLGMFARGQIPDPGYSRVKALADYFRRRDGGNGKAGRRKAAETISSGDFR